MEPIIGRVSNDHLLMERNHRVEVRHSAALTAEQRNQRSLQMYFWLNEQVGRDAWCFKFANDEPGSRHLFYFVPDSVVLMFKLTWGGSLDASTRRP